MTPATTVAWISKGAVVFTRNVADGSVQWRPMRAEVNIRGGLMQVGCS
jgi:hypothetical protein